MHSFWKVFEKLTFHTCLQGLRLHVEGCGVLGFWEGAATRSSLSEINCLLSIVSLICLKSVKNMDFPSSQFYVTRKILDKKIGFPLSFYTLPATVKAQHNEKVRLAPNWKKRSVNTKSSSNWKIRKSLKCTSFFQSFEWARDQMSTLFNI